MRLSYVSAFFAFAISAWLTRQFCRPSSRLYILDYPNERSLHKHPVPRTGGIAIFAAIAVTGLAIAVGHGAGTDFFLFAASIAIIAAISFLDDRYKLEVMERLVAHIAAGCLLLVGGFILYAWQWPGAIWHWPPWIGIGFSLLFILWMINLYNFMDGMDGLAAGMAVIGFGFFALFGWMAGDSLFFGLSLGIAAASAGFLLFNFPPARIFMGDVGSAVLGLSAAALSLWGAQDGIFPFWAAILVFSPFIVDATITLVRRLVHGERVWQAHKTHYYQRLVQRWGHRKTVLYEYGLMLACGTTALWALGADVAMQCVALILWVMIYGLLAVLIPYLERRGKSGRN